MTRIEEEVSKRHSAERERRGLEHKFGEVDRRALARMCDKDLALWQSQHPQDSPQFILGQFEWNRRLTADQIKATRWAAWLGIIAAVIGALVGAVLTLVVQRMSR